MTEASPAKPVAANITNANGHMKNAALAKSGGAVFISTMIGRWLNFAAQALLSNTLGLAAFGAFTLGQAILSFLTAFSQAGLHQATARYLAMGRAQQRPEIVRGVMHFALPRVVCMSMALGLLIILVREPMATVIFQKPEMAPVLFWVGMVVPFLSGLNWLGFAMRGLRAATAEAVMKEVAHPALFLVLCACAFLVSTPTLQNAWLAFWGSTVVASCYGGMRVYRSFKSVPHVAPDHALGREIRRFALPIWFNRLLVTLMNQGDRMLLGAFSQMAQVGLYHAAQRLAAFQTMAMGSFVPMFSTAIAEAFARNDRPTIVHHYRTVVRWSMLATLPVCLVCVSFGRELLQIFGKEFDSALPVLMLVTAASFIDAAVGPAGQFLQMIGRERAGLALVIAAALLTVGLNFILIPTWGAVGAACGTGAGVIVLNLGRLITLRHFLGVLPYTWVTGKLLCVGALAAMLAWLATPLGIFVKGGILFGVFTAGTLLFSLEQEDRVMFVKWTAKLMKKF